MATAPWRTALRLAGPCLAALAMSAAAPAAGVVPLRCALEAPARVLAGQPVPLRLSLTNPGPATVHLLVWGTPFEGWLAPFVTVWRDGAEVRYGGPSVKRGDPEGDEYLRLAPGQRRSATVDLSGPFDLRRPGRYRIEPRLLLHDVVTGDPATLPRARDRHASQPLACNAVEVEVGAAP